MNQQKILGYMLGIIASSVMATLGFFVRNTSANEEMITLSRFGLGLFFLFFYLLLTGNINQIKNPRLSFSLISSGIFLALCVLFYIKSLNSINLVNAVFLLYLGPLIATGLSVILLKERLTLSKILLLGFTFLGCLFIIEFKPSFEQAVSTGYFWGILAAIFYGFFIINNRQIPLEIPSLIRSFWQLLFATITSIFFLNISQVKLSYSDISWLISIGLLHGFLAVTFTISAIKRLDVHEYSMISYLEPLVATLLGLFVYSETISPLQILGCVIIFASGVIQLFLLKND